MAIKRVDLGPVWLNVEERGRGRPLLLVHGFPLDHTMWNEQLTTLSDGCRVIAADLRGFGHSDRGDEPLTMDLFADDLNSLLDALQIDTPVTFCGLSMGGYVGWRFLARYGDHVEALIQCDTRRGRRLARCGSHPARNRRPRAAQRIGRSSARR